mmetsp:Transcript_18723/g.43482  ORF Transcript_18723/g.43482 Transcript_18723/m.43482 type:complete len:90 (+) Transcript_18723:394-663(+)
MRQKGVRLGRTLCQVDKDVFCATAWSTPSLLLCPVARHQSHQIFLANPAVSLSMLNVRCKMQQVHRRHPHCPDFSLSWGRRNSRLCSSA